MFFTQTPNGVLENTSLRAALNSAPAGSVVTLGATKDVLDQQAAKARKIKIMVYVIAALLAPFAVYAGIIFIGIFMVLGGLLSGLFRFFTPSRGW